MEVKRYGFMVSKGEIAPVEHKDGAFVRYDDIKHLLNSAQQPLTDAAQINHALKSMESDIERHDFILYITDGVCQYCGAVTDRCHCMRDD